MMCDFFFEFVQNKYRTVFKIYKYDHPALVYDRWVSEL